MRIKMYFYVAAASAKEATLNFFIIDVLYNLWS